MEVDSKEVKRHLEILGYTHIEPCLLNEFVEDLKKLIEYDRKHNHLSTLSPSPNKNCEKDYSERMKACSVPEDTVDRNCQITSVGQQVTDQREKQKIHSCTPTTWSAIKNQCSNSLRKKNVKCKSQPKEPTCYLCEYQSKSMESQSKLRMKRKSNQSHNIHISATLGIEL